MCGIVGFARCAWSPEESPGHVSAMLASIVHRGPDELGIYFNNHVALGSARLSIIDLASGKQPMSTPDERWWIAFNGEIFNYIELRDELRQQGIEFTTQSDTEVLLWALVTWGRDALPRLNGQFAFALWDNRERRVLLARDRFGERPLFYHRGVDGSFAFASEIKALFALPQVPRALDVEGLRQACHFWTTLPGRTCFRSIESLPPASWGILEADGSWRQGVYHVVPRRSARYGEDEAVTLVREAFDRAVRLRMRSDVEVALYLSGGLDSTIVSAAASRHSERRLNTFSVAFRDQAFDESAYQKQASDLIGTRHHALVIDRDDIRGCFPDVIRHSETVLFRTAPAPLYLLAREVHSAGIKVVLTGEGADENFLGYDIFKEALFLEQFSRMGSDDERIEKLSALYPYLAHFGGQQARSLVLFYRQFAGDSQHLLLSHLPRFANGAFAARLLGGGYDPASGASALLDDVRRTCADFDMRGTLDRTQVLELNTLLAGYLLSSQGDRMSSAFSVEGRYPFLDPDLSLLAAELPEDLLLRGGLNEKYILKRAFGDLLPEQIVARPKQPYRAPGTSCLRRTSGDDWLAALLQPEVIAQSGVLDPNFANTIVAQVDKMPDEQISPRFDHAYVALVSILLLERDFLRLRSDATALAGISLRTIDGRKAQAGREWTTV